MTDLKGIHDLRHKQFARYGEPSTFKDFVLHIKTAYINPFEYDTGLTLFNK
ncbi:hypothetical protein [Simonsiella muelleri]|uniref:hypothetical protein n=1 Tax=Simonsiella muelleri TaxID=72 RepID=UPI0023F1FF0A|nr:hypothetical protein [Simonsiella muelleri]